MAADYFADHCLKVNLSANSNCIFMFMFTSTIHCCPYTPLFLLVFKRGQGRLYKLVKNYINTIKCMKIRWLKFFTSLTESWALEHVKFNQITSFSHEKKRASTNIDFKVCYITFQVQRLKPICLFLAQLLFFVIYRNLVLARPPINHRLRAVSYFSLQNYCTRSLSTRAAKALAVRNEGVSPSFLVLSQSLNNNIVVCNRCMRYELDGF